MRSSWGPKLLLEVLPGRQTPNLESWASPWRAPPPSRHPILPEASLRLLAPRASANRTCQVQRHCHLPGPHAACPLPLSPSGLTGGASPPSRPAPPPSWGVLAGLQESLTAPAIEESRPPQRPEPASGASGLRPASLYHRPRGARLRGSAGVPMAHHDAGTAGRHDGTGRLAV